LEFSASVGFIHKVDADILIEASLPFLLFLLLFTYTNICNFNIYN
jgi:hypothetical protein